MEKTNNTKQYVDEFYKKIAEKNKVSDEERQRAVAYSLGYTDEDIALGGDLGLGCGNPLENAKIKEGEWVLDLGSGFRVIIVIEANSYVNIRSSRLLPKFKTQKINSWCAA